MASAPDESTVSSFPLERPPFRQRRRDAAPHAGLLPYFISGEENRLVHFLCNHPLPIFEMGNPLLLLGSTGVGKTAIAWHLAARQANSVVEDGHNREVLCLAAVDFARQYADAIAADDMPPLRQSIDQVPVLVVDDLHLIAEKGSAQDELSARMEQRTKCDRPTIVTCRRLPSEIRGLRPMLCSRVLPGLTVTIQPPADAARLVLLRELALQQEVELEHDQLFALASQLQANLPARSLAAVINHLSLWSRMHHSPITASAVESAINQIGRADELSLAEITNAVSRHFRQKSADLRSTSRKQRIVRSRSLAMFLARRLTSKSMHQIGSYFGGRDHTTVLHAIRKTESLIRNDADLRRAADELTEKLSA